MDAANKVAEQAVAIASQDTQVQLAWIFRNIVGQPALEADLASMIDSYDKLLRSPISSATDPQIGTLSIIAHALFASSRFQFIE